MARLARESLFATCAPGLEAVLYGEMRELRLSKLEQQTGGVYFEGTLEDAWRANLWLRTAVRVLMRVARFQAEDGEQLYAGAREIDWSRFLLPSGSLVVDAHSNQSRLDHTLFVAQRVKDAIADQFRESGGERPSVDKQDADLGVYVHLYRDRCTLLVDTSGSSLHKRGWRVYQGRAPLSETLAAAVVLLSGWDRRAPLIDPFCGSATLLIEAALLASGVPPGSFREGFGFERWPGHDAGRWKKAREEALAGSKRPAKVRLIGSDRSPDAIAGARLNLESAGLSDWIELEVADARDLEPRPGWNGTIISNLPYGERVGQESGVARLHQQFAAQLHQAASGYRVALLCGSRELSDSLRLRDAEHHTIRNGGLECDLVVARVE